MLASCHMKPASCFFLIPPFSLSLANTFFSSHAVRGRECLSLCALRQEKSACTAKELWVSSSHHGNIWRLIAVTSRKNEKCRHVLLFSQESRFNLHHRFKRSPKSRMFLLYFRAVRVSRLLVSLQDTVIYDRLADSSRYKEITLKHLEQFATEGEWANIAPWWQNVEIFFDGKIRHSVSIIFLFQAFIIYQCLNSRFWCWNIINLSQNLTIIKHGLSKI